MLPAVKGGSVSEEVLSFIYMTSSLAAKETIERSKKKGRKRDRESCIARDSRSHGAREGIYERCGSGCWK